MRVGLVAVWVHLAFVASAVIAAASSVTFVPGQDLAGDVAGPGSIASFRFEATAGTRFRATFVGESGFAPDVVLRSEADDAILASGPKLAGVSLPATGGYRIEVTGVQSGQFHATTGRSVPASARRERAKGSTATDSVQFDAVAGTTLRVRVTSSKGLSSVTLSGPDDAMPIDDRIAFVGSSRIDVRELRLGRTGTYALAFVGSPQRFHASIRLRPPRGRTLARGRWQPLRRFDAFGVETPFDLELNAATVVDVGDGRGPLLAVGGRIRSEGIVALFDGVDWEFTPADGAVLALAAFTNVNGPALYVGGKFRHTWGSIAFGPVNGVYRWRRGPFVAAPLDGGVNGDGDSFVSSLTAFDDGSGEKLYAAGDFVTAGGVIDGVVSPGCARWNGIAWESVGGGRTGLFGSAAVHDDGNGAALYVAGGTAFTAQFPAQRGAWRWDGVSWQSVIALAQTDGGSFGVVRSVASLAATDPPTLYAAGEFDLVDGAEAHALARRDDVAWSQPWSGDGHDTPKPESSIDAIATLAIGPMGLPAVLAAGEFVTDGGARYSVARLSGSKWSLLGRFGDSVNDDPRIHALCVCDDQQGLGPALVAVGRFDRIGGKKTFCLARWYPGGPVIAHGGP